MDETIPRHRLRKMKALIFNSFQGDPDEDSVIKTGIGLIPVDRTISGRANRMFTIKLGSPWDDYDYIRRCDQVMIVRQRASYFRLANIEESLTVNTLEQSQILSRIAHPNVASIYSAYCYNDKISLVTEHLDISLTQLDFQSYELEEWEIATIVAEVGMLHYIIVS
jgi:hypothetical protein